MKRTVKQVIQKHNYTQNQSDANFQTPFYVLPHLSLNRMHRIRGYHRQQAYIYVAFNSRSDEGISVDNVPPEGSIFQLS